MSNNVHLGGPRFPHTAPCSAGERTNPAPAPAAALALPIPSPSPRPLGNGAPRVEDVLSRFAVRVDLSRTNVEDLALCGRHGVMFECWKNAINHSRRDLRPGDLLGRAVHVEPIVGGIATGPGRDPTLAPRVLAVQTGLSLYRVRLEALRDSPPLALARLSECVQRAREAGAVLMIEKLDEIFAHYFPDRRSRGAREFKDALRRTMTTCGIVLFVDEARAHLVMDILRPKADYVQISAAEGRAPKAPSAAASPEIIGQSSVLKTLLESVDRIAATDVRVLICGDSGTGKELIAKAIHDRSPRREGPFIAVNCATLPMELFESELFGHTEGAFTGATARRGLLEEAHRGTLFLDEIGELPLMAQAKLLRVLTDGAVTPIGGDRRIEVDFRLLSATNRDLEQRVQQNEFREDLLYRLDVMTLRTPTLAERKDDVPLLLEHFLGTFSRHHGRSLPALSADARSRLENHRYPGNIRELANIAERIVLLAPQTVEVTDLDGIISPAKEWENLAEPASAEGVALRWPSAAAGDWPAHRWLNRTRVPHP